MGRILAIFRLVCSPEALRFLIVGTSNFLVSYATFRLMLAVPVQVGFKAGASQLVSYGAGVLWSYYWNRRFTFRAKGPLPGQFLRFVVLQVALAGVSAVSIDVLTRTGGLGPSRAWFLVMAVVTVVNFLACRLWVFRARGKDQHAVN